MSKAHVTRFTVEFGDCDPAGIVFYPNYLRWMDAASLHFFRAMGVPSWQELAAQTVKGAAAMVLRSGAHPGALKDPLAEPRAGEAGDGRTT